MKSPAQLNRARTGALIAASALALLAPTLPLSSTASAQPQTAAAQAPGDPTLTLSVPRRQIAYGDGGSVYSDFGIRMVAEGGPFELWSTRTSYTEGVKVTWKKPSGDVVLPAGLTDTVGTLSNFVKLRFKKVGSKKSFTRTLDGCLGAVSERVRPDAPPRSDFPRSCYYNPYALGGVQGIEEGWAASIGDPYGSESMQLKKGKYDVTVTVAPGYAEALGLTETSKTRLIVKEYDEDGEGEHAHRESRALRPAAHRPTGEPMARRADGPKPDLRSLPAWGIEAHKDVLAFSATVWNGGDSPLVVDGFRRKGQDLMDGYQYFFDAEGNQLGYQSVGTFEWDAKKSHQHWHFRDFAAYTLLRADKSEVNRSRKEAFCLANTDAVDLTGLGSIYNVENTDLSTACGEYGSLSIREALMSGWGDTYAQFRAGQAFRLKGLPNGIYYIKVEGNPGRNLVESNTNNNVSYRRIKIGGKPGARTVKVPPLGNVVENTYTEEY